MQFSAPFVYGKSEETESIDLNSILVELRQFFTICRWSSFQVYSILRLNTRRCLNSTKVRLFLTKTAKESSPTQNQTMCWLEKMNSNLYVVCSILYFVDLTNGIEYIIHGNINSCTPSIWINWSRVLWGQNSRSKTNIISSEF